MSESRSDRRARGRLKIFFGYAAGVGKTRAMLQAAQDQIAGGARVLLGGDLGRTLDPGTELLGAGFEVIGPTLEGTPGGSDLDAVLLRKPDLVLLPGLWRQNPAGSRHRRRCQDVEELLVSGIDVWSTLEVGHIESLADLVERIVGSRMEDTIPDAIFDSADEVELIDLAPEDLLDRIRRGRAPRPNWKVRDGGTPERATLVALREITLRRAADRLSSREQGQRDEGRQRATGWQTVERLLVCVGPSPTSARVIRTASRMARSAHGQWIAVHAGPMSDIACEDEHRVSRHLRLAESLGAQTAILAGGNVAQEIVSFARSHGVTKARQRERRTELLYQLSQDLSATTGHLQIAAAVETRLSGLLDGDVSILLPDERGNLRPVAPGPPRLARDERLQEIASWVYSHGRMAGAGTETHADAPSLYLPLSSPAGVAGVLAVKSRDPDLLLLPDRRQLIETFAAHVALALQRDQLTEQVHRTFAEAENERLRSAVLSSVSHDFRTPLAAIAGASSSLLDAGDRIAPEEQRNLLQSIYEEADRLARLVDNLLQMTRLESGQIEPRREWHIVEDLVGSALTRLARHLATHEVTTCIPGQGMPMVRVDGVLIELVLANLLDNAAKYSPAGSSIEVSARVEGARVLVEVADRGPGLSAEEKAKAFEKFYRGPARRRDGSRGTGLGLTIAAAVARLHGGSLTAEDREGGGSRFVLALPVEEQRKIEPDPARPRYLITEQGVGYRLVEE